MPDVPIEDRMFELAGGIVDRATNVVVLSHHRPDGDAIGSTLAVHSVLAGRGKRVTSLLLDSIPNRYRQLAEGIDLQAWNGDEHRAVLAETEVIIVLDTSSWPQLEAVTETLRQASERVIVVDHHQTADDVGKVRLIDPTAAAAGLILYEWWRTLGWDIPQAAAEGLFAAIATDTGWFRFSNADARALRAAAELVEAGAEPYRLYESIYWSETRGRIALMARALESMDLHADGRLAVMAISRDDFAACGADPSESEDLINEPMRIGSVIVSVLLVEQPEGPVRVSLRSKGQVNVADVAAGLGGGGHARAAGARMDAPLGRAREEIVRVLERAIKDGWSSA